jgi:peptidoglycan hydrolase-like protein with peptidoglycan-binding domain
MIMKRRKRAVAIVLAVAVALAAGAWVAGGQIRSPAQIASETAAPNPSDITVPVERQVLTSEVIVRGTVRYGSPQPVVLANSSLKQGSGSGADPIVTTRPRPGARFGEGTVIMSVSGRPVFVLRGSQPAHRDMSPGSRGPDVHQLESALARMGFSPGSIDGRYDGQTAAAVAAWYERNGREPFGATDTQLEQLNTAEDAAATARDAYLQSQVAIKDAAKGPLQPGEVEQARIDVETARDAVDTAVHEVAVQARAVQLATLNEKKDNALAETEVVTKRAALNRARDTHVQAQQALTEAPPDTPPSERFGLQTAIRQAADDAVVAQSELNTSIANFNATRSAGRDAVAQARAARDRARKALPTARRQVALAQRRLRVMQSPGDASLQRALSQAAASEARRTKAQVSRLARKMGVSVPADEVQFFPTLPLRVDSVRVQRGDSVTGRVMTVSNSRLAVDSSLALSDSKLVRAGASVRIEEPDLGIKTTGVVSQVADSPGTHKVDPTRVYLEVSPKTAPSQLVGASVRLTIAVRSTQQAVLVTPVTALSVGADGNARVQVQRSGKTDYVNVEPGLAAKGLVEVRPVGGKLAPGDLVIVGARRSRNATDAGSEPVDEGQGATPAPSPGEETPERSEPEGGDARSSSGDPAAGAGP